MAEESPTKKGRIICRPEWLYGRTNCQAAELAYSWMAAGFLPFPFEPNAKLRILQVQKRFIWMDKACQQPKVSRQTDTCKNLERIAKKSSKKTKDSRKHVSRKFPEVLSKCEEILRNFCFYIFFRISRAILRTIKNILTICKTNLRNSENIRSNSDDILSSSQKFTRQF